MTVQEVASRAAVSAKTVYRAIGGGQLAATRIGRCLRVTGAAFDEWIGLAAQSQALRPAASRTQPPLVL